MLQQRERWRISKWYKKKEKEGKIEQERKEKAGRKKEV